MEQARRTYIYYSDDKILAQQARVPKPRWKRATGRVNQAGVMVLGTGLSVGLGPPETEPILRTMQGVWMDLGDEGAIGTFDEPEKYFYGRLTFYYGIFEMVDPAVFFLVGATDRTIVALGGSKHHVRGFRGRPVPVPDKEAQPVVMEPDVATLIYESALPEASAEIAPARPGEDIRAIHVALMHQNWEFWKGRRMEFEVLAERELLSPVSPPTVNAPMNVLIGSPVFVATV